MKRISLALLIALVAIAGFSTAASAAPSALKFKPKNPTEGQKVTITGKGYKHRAKYKIIVNDKVYKRSYRTSKHGKLKFSFKMPGVAVGQAIFVGVKQGKTTSIAEIFIAETPSTGAENGATKEACDDSPYPPFADGTCYAWDFGNGIDDPDEGL
jgi:hypothetical protein